MWLCPSNNALELRLELRKCLLNHINPKKLHLAKSYDLGGQLTQNFVTCFGVQFVAAINRLLQTTYGLSSIPPLEATRNKDTPIIMFL